MGNYWSSMRTDEVEVARIAPALWNPLAAALWSLLLSPIFGAVLQMKNWQALGEDAKATEARNWAIGLFILLVVENLLAGVFLPRMLCHLITLAMFVGWYTSQGKVQRHYVANAFGDDYPRRGWSLPLLMGIVISVMLSFLVTHDGAYV